MEKIIEESSGLILGIMGTLIIFAVLAALLSDGGPLREAILYYMESGI
ncbi:MAG: hypothetical protein ACI4HI_00260 [Lachnospiraceae bacterium]